jgi:hypothetical protein
MLGMVHRAGGEYCSECCSCLLGHGVIVEESFNARRAGRRA